MAGPSSDTPPPRTDLAAAYRQLQRLQTHHTEPAWLVGEVGRRMAERLQWIKAQPEKALLWWPELGGGEATLRQQYPGVQLFSQATPGARATAAAPWWQALTRPFKASAPLPWDVNQVGPVQLVWANMMLHWVNDLNPLLSRWHQALASDGFLMFSCLGPDTVRRLRELFLSLGHGPAGPEFMDMHDLGDALVHAGFADPVMDMEMLTLSWPNAQALLAELRGLGGNTAPERFQGLRTARWREHLLTALDLHLRGPDGRLSLRFELIYGHAFKPVPRPKKAEHTTVSLDTMRTLVRQGKPGTAA
jgi:malonyl-CoA O-methyltransferase